MKKEKAWSETLISPPRPYSTSDRWLTCTATNKARLLGPWTGIGDRRDWNLGNYVTLLIFQYHKQCICAILFEICSLKAWKRKMHRWANLNNVCWFIDSDSKVTKLGWLFVQGSMLKISSANLSLLEVLAFFVYYNLKCWCIIHKGIVLFSLVGFCNCFMGELLILDN